MSQLFTVCNVQTDYPLKQVELSIFFAPVQEFGREHPSALRLCVYVIKPVLWVNQTLHIIIWVTYHIPDDIL